MRRLYTVTVVMQMEEPDGMPSATSEIQEAMSKQFVISAVQLRLRDMFKGATDFSVAGVVILNCKRIFP